MSIRCPRCNAIDTIDFDWCTHCGYDFVLGEDDDYDTDIYYDEDDEEDIDEWT